ncbi:MAG: hypothetical protein AAB528_05110, partial [Chloroflexota bacterium]
WRRQLGPLVVITPRPEDARRLHDQIQTYLGETAPVYLLPEPEVLPFERLAVDANTSNQRLAALAALAASADSRNGGGQLFPLVVTSIGAALLRTLPPEAMVGKETGPGEVNPRRLRIGDKIRLNQLLACWVDLGYHHEPLVEFPGCFSLRGGIIDVYPPHCDSPFRIELWDDEVETIRVFDPYTQRSLRNVDEVRLFPAREQLPNLVDRKRVQELISRMDTTRCGEEVRERIEGELVALFSGPNVETLSFYNGLLNRHNLLEYVPQNGRVVLERAVQIEAEALELEERFTRMRTNREERGELPGHFPSPHISWGEFSAELERRTRILLHSWAATEDDHIFEPATPYYGRLEQLASDIRRYQREGRALVAVTQHARRLAEILEQAGAAA